MLTIDALKTRGSKVEEGLARCMNNESFYLRLTEMALKDGNIEGLRAALDQNDAKAAFEAAHALKGALGNLSLTPLFEPASALTELLRGAAPGDPVPAEASPLADAFFTALADHRALLD